MAKFLLSSNGDFDYSYRLDRDYDCVIAVDGGIRHLERLGIKPAYWLGDMDSSSSLSVDKDFITDVKIEKLPVKKDMSDSDYAVSRALSLGAKDITMIGGIGSRFDHSLFNINLFFKLSKNGISSKILDGRQELYFLIAEGKKVDFYLREREGETLSIVPFSDLRALSLDGFEYPLHSKDISRYSNLTLSNIIESNEALIRLKEGSALIILSSGY